MSRIPVLPLPCPVRRPLIVLSLLTLMLVACGGSNPPLDFTLDLNSTSLTLLRGQPGQVTAHLSRAGGFTGPGANSDIAGFVHANEFVINAKNTSKYPKSFLDSLNGYADGGMVQSLSGPSLSSPAGRIAEGGGSHLTFAPVTSISVDSRSDRAAVLQDVQRVVSENQKQYTESLKRMKVIPS